MQLFLKTLIALCIGCLFAGRQCLYAQKQASKYIDSLLQELPKAVNDTNKVLLLDDLSFGYYTNNTDEGLKYGNEELELAQNWDGRKELPWHIIQLDFVNFTTASEAMHPQALIDELHNCFKAFDEITTKYNIEKIKTIGDAYLAVAGLPAADPKHAENAVKAAIEIKMFMDKRRAKLGDTTFEIRIGINTGSVIAGIVGIKKFAYDIWGDTVNVAAEMQENSEAGKINISGTTYELVKDKFTFEYRGEIEAENKGALKMYFVA